MFCHLLIIVIQALIVTHIQMPINAVLYLLMIAIIFHAITGYLFYLKHGKYNKKLENGILKAIAKGVQKKHGDKL